MTYRTGRHVFSGVRSAALLAGTIAVIAASGCTTDAPLPVAGAINTGSYPNLNIKPQAAAAQLTNEEKAAKLAALRAAQQQQAPAPASETEEARRNRLKLLSEDGGADTLKVIENN